ncbi:MAG: hypothetical protein ABIN48_02825 [Ginsengibacter sp.]
MKKILLFPFFVIATGISFGQKQTFDLVTYTAPKGWTKEIKEGVTGYTFVDKKDKSWCQLGIYKSTVSKGNIDADFDSEWESLVKKQYHTIDTPQTDLQTAEGWDIKSGAVMYIFNQKETMVLLTTFTGNGVCISIVATTPNQRYMKDIEELMASIELKTPVAQNINRQYNPINNIETTLSNEFTFTSTNFDDGWKSEVKEDWVEVTKGNIKVLLHYPNQNIKAANTDLDVMCAAAWNTLVAPRYSNILNYQLTPGVIEYERPYFAQATLTDNATGKTVFVALFKKATGWMEFICPDRNTFLKNFGLDISSINYASESLIWEPLKKMASYNKFAVAPSDFSGKWSDKFASNTYYANIYTGASAGMSSYTSTQSFEFSGNTYKWHLVAANSYGGNSEFGQAKGNGNFKVLNNWLLWFSEMEGKPKTFDAYFSAVKGGRILWMNDANFPASGIYTGFSKEK